MSSLTQSDFHLVRFADGRDLGSRSHVPRSLDSSLQALRVNSTALRFRLTPSQTRGQLRTTRKTTRQNHQQPVVVGTRTQVSIFDHGFRMFHVISSLMVSAPRWHVLRRTVFLNPVCCESLGTMPASGSAVVRKLLLHGDPFQHLTSSVSLSSQLCINTS